MAFFAFFGGGDFGVFLIFVGFGGVVCLLEYYFGVWLVGFQLVGWFLFVCFLPCR